MDFLSVPELSCNQATKGSLRLHAPCFDCLEGRYHARYLHPHDTSLVCLSIASSQHTTTIYLNNEVAQFAQELVARLPGRLSVAYFVNSGSEANDMALTMARLYTGNWDVISLRNAYHGLSEGTMGAMGIQSWKPAVPQGFGVRHAMCPDPYRGRFGQDLDAYVSDVQEVRGFGVLLLLLLCLRHFLALAVSHPSVLSKRESLLFFFPFLFSRISSSNAVDSYGDSWLRGRIHCGDHSRCWRSHSPS